MKLWRSASLRSDCRVSEALKWLKMSQERRQPVVLCALTFTHILHCSFRGRNWVLLYLTLFPNWILLSDFDLMTCYVCPASVPVVFKKNPYCCYSCTFSIYLCWFTFTLGSVYKQGCETGKWIILWPHCLPAVSTASFWLCVWFNTTFTLFFYSLICQLRW